MCIQLYDVTFCALRVESNVSDLMACNERFSSDSQPTDVTVLKSVLTTRKELRHSETGTAVVIRPVPLRIVSLESCENLQVCITYVGYVLTTRG